MIWNSIIINWVKWWILTLTTNNKSLSTSSNINFVSSIYSIYFPLTVICILIANVLFFAITSWQHVIIDMFETTTTDFLKSLKHVFSNTCYWISSYIYYAIWHWSNTHMLCKKTLVNTNLRVRKLHQRNQSQSGLVCIISWCRLASASLVGTESCLERLSSGLLKSVCELCGSVRDSGMFMVRNSPAQ